MQHIAINKNETKLNIMTEVDGDFLCLIAGFSPVKLIKAVLKYHIKGFRYFCGS